MLIETQTSTTLGMYGGKGNVKIERILDDVKLGGKCGLFARVTLEVGASLGTHKHEGESETYYISEGRALYVEDGMRCTLEAGETVYCADGSCHGIDNIGSGELSFMALIIKA